MKRFLDIRNELNIECPRAKGAYLENAPEEIWTEPGWVLEPKIDGNRLTLQIGAERSLLIGRNRLDFLKGVDKAGKFRDLSNLNPELQSIADPFLDGTILDGELTECFKQDGTHDKSTLDRIKNGDFTGYTAWTCLFYGGEDIRGLSEENRRNVARLVAERLNHPKIRLIKRVPATEENLASFFKQGKEGAIAKKLSASIPTTNKICPTWYKLKGHKNRTVDAFVIGVSEGKEGGSGVNGVAPKPNGKAATFTVGMMLHGAVVEVGKMANLPAKAVECGFTHFNACRYKVVEMQVSGWDGARFRFPRFVKWRKDKSVRDCQFLEQVGKEKKKK